MEELLRQILAELQYHTKLMESLMDLADTKRGASSNKQKEMKEALNEVMDPILNNPNIKGRPEIEGLKRLMKLGGL